MSVTSTSIGLVKLSTRWLIFQASFRTFHSGKIGQLLYLGTPFQSPVRAVDRCRRVGCAEQLRRRHLQPTQVAMFRSCMPNASYRRSYQRVPLVQMMKPGSFATSSDTPVAAYLRYSVFYIRRDRLQVNFTHVSYMIYSRVLGTFQISDFSGTRL